MNLAIEKYGWNNIQHNILYTNLNQDDAKNIERHYIAKYNTNDLAYGYNRTIGGDAHICKPVICNGYKYKSLESFCSQNNLSVKTVGDWLNGRTPMDPDYYNKGLRYENQIHTILKGKKFQKMVVCDGINYKSIREFARQNNLNAGTVTHWLNGDKGMPEVWYNLNLRYINDDNSKIRKAVRH